MRTATSWQSQTVKATFESFYSNFIFFYVFGFCEILGLVEMQLMRHLSCRHFSFMGCWKSLLLHVCHLYLYACNEFSFAACSEAIRCFLFWLKAALRRLLMSSSAFINKGWWELIQTTKPTWSFFRMMKVRFTTEVRTKTFLSDSLNVRKTSLARDRNGSDAK